MVENGTYTGKIASLPRLSGQIANTMTSVGNEQKASNKKFVLQRKTKLCPDCNILVPFLWYTYSNSIKAFLVLHWILQNDGHRTKTNKQAHKNTDKHQEHN